MDRKSNAAGQRSERDNTIPLQNYDQLLNAYGAADRSASEAVAYLESLGYSRSQARNAVYRFRQRYKGVEGR